MARAWLACVVACGCGRLDFDVTSQSAGLALSYPRPDIVAVVNATVVSLVPVVSDPTARFAIEPALPSGLAIDRATGAVSGTPTETAEATYVVTATTARASATAELDLTALPGYVVTSTADVADDDGGTDTVCAAASTGGLCTLRAAIQTINQRTVKQLVLLDAQTYALAAALDPIANDVVIAGRSAAATTIRAATVHAPYAALALAVPHSLALLDLAIQDFGGSQGGALGITDGELDVDRCAFTNNASPTSGGVLFINGGAKATLSRSTFTGNRSNGGSGGGWGGVIDGEGANTTIVVTRSTATGNQTEWGSFSHITTGTTLRLENSTLYGNTATTAGTLATPGGLYTLVNDTIVGNINTNTDSAGIYLYAAPSSYTVTNTIVAFNTDTAGEHDCNRNDLMTTITSGGGNIVGDAAGNCAMYFTGRGDLLSTDPGVESGAPADHGGPTATILLTAGAPALDGGQAATCPPIDQRGQPRPAGTCDVGAVQMP